MKNPVVENEDERPIKPAKVVAIEFDEIPIKPAFMPVD
jgi:hypothetical protein